MFPLCRRKLINVYHPAPCSWMLLRGTGRLQAAPRGDSECLLPSSTWAHVGRSLWTPSHQCFPFYSRSCWCNVTLCVSTSVMPLMWPAFPGVEFKFFAPLTLLLEGETPWPQSPPGAQAFSSRILTTHLGSAWTVRATVMLYITPHFLHCFWNALCRCQPV